MIIKLASNINAHDLLYPLSPEFKDVRLIKRIVTNSNEASEDSVFIGLKGLRDDGNKYSKDAKRKGAIVISNDEEYADIFSADGISAIKKIARSYKENILSLNYTIAITGSVGKTTTKNILKELLSYKYRTHATSGNYNNILGVCITILSAPLDTEILIAEAGMNHKGELSEISEILCPNIAIITNIGTSHIGYLGSRENIAEAKLEIINERSTKIVIVPHGEPLLDKLERKLTFSASNGSADCFVKIESLNKSESIYSVYLKSFDIQNIRTTLTGEHILNLVSASVCCLDYLGVNKDELNAALERIDRADTRGKMIKIGRIKIYDDSYNASYESFLAAFKTVALFGNKKSCVIGDILELGEMTEEIHRTIGKELVNHGFKKLFTFGKNATYTAQGAIMAGMDQSDIYINENINDPQFTAEEIIKCYSDEIILFKASHTIAIDRIYEKLRELEERKNDGNA